jgi:3-phenylpropionate/cinnamic acid dioxygenase small subunit
MPVDTAKIEWFLYHEADLMDGHQYDDWLALWTDDCLYWVPSNLDDYDPSRHVSILYDDRTRLEDRITQLKSSSRWSQEPKSRMCRLISNIEVEEGQDGEITVNSRFILIELRRGEQDTFAARQVHKLRSDGNGSFKIAFKKVMLVNNDEVIGNLTFLL